MMPLTSLSLYLGSTPSPGMLLSALLTNSCDIRARAESMKPVRSWNVLFLNGSLRKVNLKEQCWVDGSEICFWGVFGSREMIWHVPNDVARKGSLYYGLYCCIWQTYLLLLSIIQHVWRWWSIAKITLDGRILRMSWMSFLVTFYMITPWFVVYIHLSPHQEYRNTYKTSHPTWPSPRRIHPSQMQVLDGLETPRD